MLSSYRILVDGLKVLPGVGERTANRLAADILSLPAAKLERMLGAIENARSSLRTCEVCFSYAEGLQCPVCASHRGASDSLCIVGSPLDVWSIERTDRYQGQYHVLGGVLSPVDGIGPRELNWESLLTRLRSRQYLHVIFALPATPEAEATAHFIRTECADLSLQFQQLAYGIPVGGALDYADPRTVGFAFDNRRDL